MALVEEFDNGFRVRHIADQDGTFIVELMEPEDADLTGWTLEVTDRSGSSHIERFVHEWRGERGYVWEALVDSDETIVR